MDKPEAGERDPLLRLAASVSDRETVAWEDESERAPDLTRTLVRLRGLAALAAEHERFRSSSGTATGPAQETAQLVPSSGMTWGPLRIVESVGRGGFGHVYRAFDPRLDREVALKLWRRRSP